MRRILPKCPVCRLFRFPATGFAVKLRRDGSKHNKLFRYWKNGFLTIFQMQSSDAIQLLDIQDDNRIFADMVNDDANPCLSCGACCQYFRVSMYMGEMTGAGGTVPDELVSQVNPYIVCMKGTEAGYGRCVALRGEVGKPGIHCAIYAQRPSPCREFRVWADDGSPNPDCQRLRERAGLPPLAAMPA